MKKLFAALFLGLFLLASGAAAMDDSGIVLQRAAQNYKDGKYQKAEEGFRQLLERYPHSWELMYNLGNVYAKNGQLGKAVLYYEKARQFRPRDKELNENLAFITGMLKFKVEDKRNWYWRQWLWLLDQLSWFELAFTASGIYLLWLLLHITALLTRREDSKWFFARQPLFFLLLLLALPLAFKAVLRFHQPPAVVVNKEAGVHYGPSEKDKVAVTLGEGILVSVRQSREDWYLVKLDNGQQGWMQKADVELI